MQSNQKLNLFSLTMIVIGLVIGMGIFRTASDAARAALTPSIYFAGWIVGGLVALCGALTYAEIGSRYPVTGGYYKIFSYAYHPSLAFALNCSILISNAASIAGVALIGAGYIKGVFFPGSTDAVSMAIAIAAIALFYGVNVLGLRMSSKTQNVLMIIKIAMVLLLIAALVYPPAYAANNVPLTQPIDEGASTSTILTSFGLCLVAVSFTYGGYQQTINFGSEIKDAPRTMPKGIFLGIGVIILLYLLVNIAYYNIIGFNELKNSREIASLVVGKLFGTQGANVFSVLLFLSVLAYVNVTLLSNPRVMFAMSEDGVLPEVFQRRWQRRNVYIVALTTFAAIAMVVVFFAETFDRILSFSIFLDSFGMATSAATIFILRKRTKHLDKKGIYKMRLYPLMPLLFIAAYVFVCISIAVTSTNIAITGVGVMVGFILLYFVIKKRPPKYIDPATAVEQNTDD
ncbi:APC family permease [Aridibaculum aurantiacum]|uniref:APC family permease n=1 Tax=Aridibaculum aurantiacum TaxID=2810307 RepID=UPI001A97CC93|nr:APC family permease [Aridibaculum aurantiacum]